MLKIAAIATAIIATATPALTEEQIKAAGDETLSIGDWGKVLNQTVFACRLPGDLETHGSLMIQMNTLQIAKGEPVKASPDGACWPLIAGTEVQFVRTAEANNNVICVRRRDDQDCSWTFKAGIVPAAVYDRQRADTEGFSTALTNTSIVCTPSAGDGARIRTCLIIATDLSCSSTFPTGRILLVALVERAREGNLCRALISRSNNDDWL